MTGGLVKEQVANRAGFRLADVVAVALPVYRLRLRVLTHLQRALPTIDEFLLRLVEAGIHDTPSLASFLGLEVSFVNEALNRLLREELLLTRPSNAQDRFRVALKGKKALETALTITPEERTYSVEFDALRRSIVPYGRERLMAGSEVRAAGRRQVPHFLPRPIDAVDLVHAEVQQAIQLSGQRRDQRRSVLAIHSIERSSLAFLPALMLVFHAVDGEDVQVSFLVEGRLSVEHERAFAQRGGVHRMGIERELEHSRRELVPVSFLDRVRASDVAEGNNGIGRISVPTSHGAPDPFEHLSEPQRQSLAEHGHIELLVHQHEPLLRHALQHSVYRLLIISPFINAHIVDRSFLARLEELLRRGVSVYIGYGMPESDSRKTSKHTEECVRTLSALGSRYSCLYVAKTDSHAKVLISDGAFVVIGSFNWLSFEGNPDQPVRYELSVASTVPGFVEANFQREVRPFSTEVVR